MAKKRIRKAVVIGGGVMGSGIAAHLANARIPVHLLDIVPKPGEDDDPEDPAFRNKLARNAIQKMKKASPSPIYLERDLELITPGNVEDDLDALADADWVVEAVPERMSIKQDTFAKIEEHAGEDTIIASNTSGLSIEGMLEGRSDAFKERFLVTHFFNPVRYMKLLELVPAQATSEEVVDTMVKFGRDVLGKGIVFGKDTTNFVANRIGVHGMMTIIDLMPKYEMSIEDVDQVFGKPMGRPKSAVFRTADVVGLDTFVHVSTNCYDTLTEDEDRDVFQVPEFVKEMADKGWTGQKAGQGFYKKTKEGILALRPETMEYEPRDKSEFDSLEGAKGSPADKINHVIREGDDQAADFAREATFRSLAYSARRLGEIADDIVNIDRGMRWGFNWKLGPFQTWDAIGVEWAVEQMHENDIDLPEWVDEMVEAGHETFYKWDGATRKYYDPLDGEYKAVPTDDKEISIDVLKRSDQKVMGNDGASLYDIGDGVALLEFHTKMNSVDNDIIEMMEKAAAEVDDNWKGLVIGNGSDNFSAGANLMLVLMNARAENWGDIEQMIERFQNANQKMRYISKPVVSAPRGLTLGGGAEVAMGANAIQAAGELYMGLVEVGVGLIPGGGGNLQLLRNVFGEVADEKDFDPLPFLQKTFMNIGMGEVAKSADQARKAGFLTRTDEISINADHRIHHAKQKVLGLAASGFTPPRPTRFRLPGNDGVATMDMMLYGMQTQMQISEYDRHIGKKLATVLCGGDTTRAVLTSEEKLLELEREAFLSLCGEEKTQERMQHMLMHNKPLRN
ncbi:MAG: 3-hydroxyacyl-CoA dehydrogenase NAD-binding domain-containing protein [Myxococcota bacterium]